jgi:hypothetical protein
MDNNDATTQDGDDDVMTQDSDDKEDRDLKPEVRGMVFVQLLITFLLTTTTYGVVYDAMTRWTWMTMIRTTEMDNDDATTQDDGNKSTIQRHRMTRMIESY